MLPLDFFVFRLSQKVPRAPRQGSPRLPAAEWLKGHPVSPLAARKNGGRGDSVWTSGASNITQRARDLKCSWTYHQRINRWGRACQMSAGGSKKLSFHTRTRRWNLRALLLLQWHELKHRHWFFFFFLISRETERAISWFPLTAKSGLVLRNVWLFGLYVPFNEAVSTQPFRCAAQRICHFNTMDKGVFYSLGDRLFAVAAACERKALTRIFPHCLLRDTQQKTVKPSYYRDAVNPDSGCMAVWLVVWDQ